MQDNRNPKSDILRGRKRKSPLLAFLLSLLMSGLGQFYNRQTYKGCIHLAVSIMSFLGMITSIHVQDSERLFALCVFVKLVNYLWSLIMAPLDAGRINGQLLDEAVLDVMYEAYNKKRVLQRGDISSLIGILESEEINFNYPTVEKVLRRLEFYGLVRQESPEPSATWTLTEKAIESQLVK